MRGAESEKGISPTHFGPWPVNSRLANLRKGARHPRPKAERMGDHSSGARGSAFWRVCSRIGSVAEVSRQHAAYAAPERRASGSRRRSSPQHARASAGRKSVGSRTTVAKPGDRWRVPIPNKRTRKASRRGTTCWRKASWGVKAAVFDEMAGEALLVL